MSAFFEQVDYAPNPVALAACALCDVRAECLAFAITTNCEYGVFGALTRRERRPLRLAAAS